MECSNCGQAILITECYRCGKPESQFQFRLPCYHEKYWNSTKYRDHLIILCKEHFDEIKSIRDAQEIGDDDRSQPTLYKLELEILKHCNFNHF